MPKSLIAVERESAYAHKLSKTKFPSKIVALILKLNEKRYFDGKNMYDKNTKDFKI